MRDYRNLIIPLLLFLLLLSSSGERGPGEWGGVVSRGDRLVRSVALTFDDGPHEKLTPLLLDVLDELSVPAAFFLVGSMAEKHPDLVREIHRRGHTVANHSYAHRSSVALSGDELGEDLRRCSAILEGITTAPVCFFRPPGGGYNNITVDRARKGGMKVVLWDVNSGDYTGVSAGHIKSKILRWAAPGSVLLFHSGVQATIDALPEIVGDLRKRGYEFVNLDSMFGRYRAFSPPSGRTHLALLPWKGDEEVWLSF